jgi:hypothetical protein
LRGLSGTRLALLPSWFLAAAILGLHAAAAAAMLIAMPGWAGWALAAALAALGLSAAWSRALLRSPQSPRALVLNEKGIELETANGRIFSAPRAESRHVSRFMVTLPVSGRTILVTRDMLGGEEFRRLRLWALWGRLPRRSVAAAQL